VALGKRGLCHDADQLLKGTRGRAKEEEVMSDNKNKMDIDGDGVVEAEELALFGRRMQGQRTTTQISMVSVVLFTALLFTPFISIDRINALSDVLPMFYLGNFSIIGAYMGITLFMTKGK
jgi:hypothetical protein